MIYYGEGRATDRSSNLRVSVNNTCLIDGATYESVGLSLGAKWKRGPGDIKRWVNVGITELYPLLLLFSHFFFQQRTLKEKKKTLLSFTQPTWQLAYY